MSKSSSNQPQPYCRKRSSSIPTVVRHQTYPQHSPRRASLGATELQTPSYVCTNPFMRKVLPPIFSEIDQLSLSSGSHSVDDDSQFDENEELQVASIRPIRPRSNSLRQHDDKRTGQQFRYCCEQHGYRRQKIPLITISDLDQSSVFQDKQMKEFLNCQRGNIRRNAVCTTLDADLDTMAKNFALIKAVEECF